MSKLLVFIINFGDSSEEEVMLQALWSHVVIQVYQLSFKKEEFLSCYCSLWPFIYMKQKQITYAQLTSTA